MLKLNDAIKNRVQDGLKKYARIVAKGRERGMNERDTSDVARAMLGDMLGYDPFFDVTTEASVRGQHAAYAAQTEGRTQFLVIVKPLGVTPHAAHLLRLGGAGTPPYTDWVVLTKRGDVGLLPAWRRVGSSPGTCVSRFADGRRKP